MENKNEKNFPENFLRKLGAEFVGTMILNFTAVSLGTSGSGLLGISLATGILIALLIIGIGRISGGHFDPAVTFAVFICRDIRWPGAVFFSVAQIFGGIFGAFLGKISIGDFFYFGDGINAANGINVPGHIQFGFYDQNPVLDSDGNFTWTIYSADGPVGIPEILVAEIIITFVLVLTGLMAAVDGGEKNVLAPLAIGFSVFVNILILGNVSGGSMNPARSFGPALIWTFYSEKVKKICALHPIYERFPEKCLERVWIVHYAHWVGPFIGAAIGAILYKFFLASKPKRIYGDRY